MQLKTVAPTASLGIRRGSVKTLAYLKTMATAAMKTTVTVHWKSMLLESPAQAGAQKAKWKVMLMRARWLWQYTWLSEVTVQLRLANVQNCY